MSGEDEYKFRKLPLRKPAAIWLVASKVHGADASTDRNYPHICGREVPSPSLPFGGPQRYLRRDCLACAAAGGPVDTHVGVAFEDYSTLGAAKTGVEWQWSCPLCRVSGPANSEANAHGLTNLHLVEACPGTAQVYYGADDPDCYVFRVARHQNLHRVYPEQVPAWEGRFRGDKSLSTGHLPMCDPECREKHVLTAEDLESLGALASLD